MTIEGEPATERSRDWLENEEPRMLWGWLAQPFWWRMASENITGQAREIATKKKPASPDFLDEND